MAEQYFDVETIEGHVYFEDEKTAKKWAGLEKGRIFQGLITARSAGYAEPHGLCTVKGNDLIYLGRIYV